MTHIHKLIDLRTNPEFNSIKAPFGHLGVSRSAMPQIDNRDDFIAWLKNNKVKVKNIRVPIKSLKMSQSEYDRDKVMEIMNGMRTDLKKFSPIFVSSDGYVIDGNHRFIAKMNVSDARYIDVTEVDMPMMQILDFIKDYHGVRYRTLHDKQVK